MLKRVWLASLVLGAALGTVHCGEDTAGTDLDVTVTVSPASLLADGEATALVSIDAGDYTGPMQLTTTQGYLTAGAVPAGSQRTINLGAKDGKATAVLRSCDATDPSQRPCGGAVRVTASADSSQGVGFVEFVCDGDCSGGEGGSGGSGGTGGTGEGGSGGTGGTGGIVNRTVEVTLSRAQVRNEFESVLVTATIKKDGVKDSAARGDVIFRIATTGGELVGVSATPNPVAVAPGAVEPVTVTAASGVATAYVTGRGVSTVATVTATYGSASGTAELQLDPGADLQEIRKVSVTPSTVGVRDTIKTSLSEIVFELRDEDGATAAPGLPVTFAREGDVTAEVQPTSAFTDSSGRVKVVFTAGGVRGPISVIARAQRRTDARVVTGSAEVVVVNGVPSQKSFTFLCKDGDYTPSWHCSSEEISCLISLADRSSGPADPDWSITVESEAGAMVEQIYTTDAAGETAVQHRVQEPHPDDPSILVRGQGKALPLVTLIARTRGEEAFIDCPPNNGVYDPPTVEGLPQCTTCTGMGTTCSGEPFVDISEPFMDNDDDGVFTDGENYNEVRGPAAGGTESFDLGNGTWDRDTWIWKTVKVLWIGDLGEFTFYKPPGYDPTDPSTLPSCSDLRLRAMDEFGNCMSPRGTGEITLAALNAVQGSFPGTVSNKFKPGRCFDLSEGDWSRTDVEGNPDPLWGPQDYPVSFLPKGTPPATVTVEAQLKFKNACESASRTYSTSVVCVP